MSHPTGLPTPPKLVQPVPLTYPTDTEIDFDTLSVRINYPLKVAFLYCYDPDVPDDAYDQLREHLEKQGFFLQIEVGPRGQPMPGQPGGIVNE